ncbi:LuxR C-terminal-related transcriptional regulator [Ferrimonas sp. SCSIO 43195]|uniref:helix-turn-helix transcriptional regulator n=1 Tax=Ferrimonas sp. SCSIO 43195 TaxID=2822844 RepID=UPI0020754A77|nr:LuxR C-terminal-related transcriptional regulator [Ferrimonas sp. SCSIO 43195]USD37483.1 helix-turn-helix transcriptional regulator [Ferrimonas sp. SCSIO 43195]
MTENCPLPDGVVGDLMDLLAPLGVQGFFYGITTDVTNTQIHSFRKLHKRLPLEMARARYAVFSDERTRLYRDTYLRVFARHDPCYFERKRMGPNLWRQPAEDQEQLKRLLEEFNIRSRVAWLLPCRYHPGWISVFLLHSSLPEGELKAALSAHQVSLERGLRVFSDSLASQWIQRLNPIYNFRCITDKGLEVLRLAAEGMASQSIARKLCLTERGVNYHIDRMKALFGAKNRAQLISRGFQMGILNSPPPEAVCSATDGGECL